MNTKYDFQLKQKSYVECLPGKGEGDEELKTQKGWAWGKGKSGESDFLISNKSPYIGDYKIPMTSAWSSSG